jgi:sec-independent protein translocase protein TatA
MGFDLLSPTHLILLAVIGLLLFGAKRLPEVGRSLGTGFREFKDSVTSDGLTPTSPAPVESRSGGSTAE